MDKIRIDGWTAELNVERFPSSGAKNACLASDAGSTLLTEEPLTLMNAPRLVGHLAP